MPEVLLPPLRRTLRPKGQRDDFFHDFFSASAHTRLLLRGWGGALVGDRKHIFPWGGASSFLWASPSPAGLCSGLTRLEELSFGLQLLPLCQRWCPGQVVAGQLLQKASVGLAGLG